MKSLLRWFGLTLLAVLALQLFFVFRIAAMAVLDAAIRKIPGALGDAQSAQQESFANPELLDWPHYTRPEIFNGLAVPDVLLSGHHERISDWRRQAAQEATLKFRPDLLDKSSHSKKSPKK